MSFYNNFLALPTLIPMILVSGELPGFINSIGSYSRLFYFIFIWSGISGLLLSICSFWAVRTTSPTTYSMVGSLNKIPLTILGVIFFDPKMKLVSAISITIGLSAGALYSITKSRLSRIVEPTLPRVSSNMILDGMSQHPQTLRV